jgi:hypothetical protein
MIHTKIFDSLEVSKNVFICNMIYIHVPLICFKTLSTQISINLLDCTRLQVGFLSDVLTWYLFWGPKVDESLQEVTRFDLSTDFGGVLILHSGELLIRFLPTAAIRIVWHIRNFFGCLEVSKYVFICNMIYIRVPLLVSKVIITHICIKILDCSRLHIGLFSDILTCSLFWGPKV